MAARPTSLTDKATAKVMVVATGQTVAAGRRVKHGSADNEVQHAGVGDIGIGEVLDAGAAGARVRVLLDGPVVPVVVGTGGATRGAVAKPIANGMTDATPASSGSTVTHSPGVFLESGVVGDQVGMVKTTRMVLEA